MIDHNKAAEREIADHGVIGNLSTTALVATDGAIDFLCWPHFDSPTIFAALLDVDQGGVFVLSPRIDDARTMQMYLPDTNVLLTRWIGETTSVEIIDLMPIPDANGDCVCRLIRSVRVTRGTVTIDLRCTPRPDYARQRPKVTVIEDAAMFSSPDGLSLRLTGPVAFAAEDDGATARFTLNAGERADFVLDDEASPRLEGHALEAAIQRTTRDWRDWAKRSTYKGRWREAVTRSALVLKLLTSKRHGSIAAAATFGLPEARGGSRNWDYRATWIRDASFTVYSLMRLGYLDEATAFTRWVADRAVESGGRLDIMYAMDGSPEPPETALDHLAGYGGAKPVVIGNAAAGQLQLDIYGELLDSIYLSNKYGEAISHADWLGVRHVVDHVCKTWQTPDAGIWEVRREPREHLHSRLMCWVAVDRAIRLASKRSLAAPFETWIQARNAINDDIWENFWNPELGHFVQSKGSRELDGAILMMPLVRFIGAKDPAWLATLDAIGEQLTDDGLVRRYAGEDGLTGREGSFAACSFWYVECLARAGRLEQARANFEKLLRYGNHLHLYAEEFDARAQLIGNFPQAFTHLALISAAFYLNRALDDDKSQQWRA
ncbi:glycoside hydrolase family 15 protein [Caulobacter sp. RL271]|uniref:Glycoside hydrolase family 15 protein n=1 Tax=Caulobacter segnis TaxID=88688 RepID=A0ABY4ZTN7_9CAUL|nr:glycoside hydrolase family 15 protein [Caulobacter segnis]USQ95367.1 glycoside hydrolase family 15 protein [Caulobacter segnis]